MSEALRSVLIGTMGLGAVAAVALYLTVSRGGVGGSAAELGRTLRWGALATLLQAVHFAEELLGGFERRFPELLGLAPWPASFFVTFNLLWLAIWGLSLWGLAGRHRAALFPLWFLGIAGLVNGLAHALLSLLAGGYVPGLFTSPLGAIAGLFLLARLSTITRS
jgi:hypothetical protein